MTHIIAIANQKGGVGKTTTSVNLAACLGAMGHKILLVDMDPQGNATSAIGVQPGSVPSSLYRALIGLDIPDPVSLHDSSKNVSLLPSSPDLAGAEFDLLQIENKEFRLRGVLDSLETPFDFIIIDSPPSLSLLSINALSVADWVLVPVQAEFMALEGLASLMQTIQRIRQSFNPNLKLLGLAVTLYDSRTRLAGEVVAELERAFQSKVFKTKIVRSIRLSEAPSHGLPIIYYEAKSAGAVAYSRLAQEVYDACEETSLGSGSGSSVRSERANDDNHAGRNDSDPADSRSPDPSESSPAEA